MLSSFHEGPSPPTTCIAQYIFIGLTINLRGCVYVCGFVTRMATDQFKKQNKDSLRLLHCISFHLLLEGSNNYDSIIKLIVDNFLIIIF